ncbi:Ulp1 protease family, C-terminal catalytic domain containing protein [Trema orientale]|uniref:Ulp1 protease family, C-terminal catalytic domain containing protein n=1 Tax=Trema orientale TaxID=63057 RepID=A0A2P5F091_TREOI|nr:Ulp1 protease family, C-terminal catalytic domain containing protein [Trema orientale]
MNIIPQLLHHLVIRQIRSEKEEELAFSIVGTHYTFGLKEYAATMGLKTKGVVVIKKKNLKKESLHKYLENILAKTNKEEKDSEKHSKSVRKKHVKIAFDSYNGKNDETMLKLVKLHIIEKFLLGNQGKIMIKDEHVDILDVHWMFEDYHWGRISFKETTDSFRSATTKQGLNSYPLYGCPIALQIWASKIIAAVVLGDLKIFGQEYDHTTRKEDHQEEYSGAMQKNTEAAATMSDITEEKDSRAIEQIARTAPIVSVNAEEKEQQEAKDSGAMQKNAEAAATVSDIAEKKQKQEPKDSAAIEKTAGTTPIVSDNAREKEEQEVKGKEASMIEAHIEEEKGDIASKHKRTKATAKRILKTNTQEEKENVVAKRVKDKTTKVEGKRLIKPGPAEKSPFTTKFGLAEDEPTKEKRAKIATQSTPATEYPSFDLGISPIQVDTPVIPVPMKPETSKLKHQPISIEFDRPPMQVLIESFEEWVKNGLNHRTGKYTSKMDPELLLDLGVEEATSKKWFYSIWKPTEMLSGSLSLTYYYNLYQMNVVYFLRKKIKYNPTLHQKRTTTLDTISDDYIKKTFLANIDDKKLFTWDEKPHSILLQYAKGKRIAVGKKWTLVDSIYVPAFITQLEHWVLVEIDLPTQKIKVYDSIGGTAHKLKVKSEITASRIAIPNLLAAANFYEKRIEIKQGNFEIEFVEGLEIQSNVSNCGMFVIKWAEALMTNVSTGEVTQEKMIFFWQKLATELYH